MIVHHAPSNCSWPHVPLIKVTLFTDPAAYVAETMRMVNDTYAPDVYESEQVTVCYIRPPSYWEREL